MKNFVALVLAAVMVSYCGTAPVSDDLDSATSQEVSEDKQSKAMDNIKKGAIIVGVAAVACYAIPKLQKSGNTCSKIVRGAYTKAGDKLKLAGRKIKSLLESGKDKTREIAD